MRNKLFLSFGVVLGIAFLFGERLLAQVSPGPNEALYFFSPSSGNHSVSDTFAVELRIGTSESVTSLKAYINFDSALLSPTSIDTTGSAFQTFWEETFTASQVQLQASEPAPGFLGTNGLVATLTFEAAGAGTANLTYDTSSLALKEDDTNILNIAGSETASFEIASSGGSPPPPSSGGGGGGGGGSSGTGGLIGDCSGDNKVDIFDLSILLSNWKKATSTCDLNGDTTIDIFDLSMLLSNWKK